MPRAADGKRLLVLGLNPALELTYFLQPPLPGVTTARAFNLEPGGKSTNVARILARRGREVTLLSPVAGPFAPTFRQLLPAEVDLMVLDGGPDVRASLVLVVDEVADPLVIRVDGEAQPALTASTLDALDGLLDEGRVLVLSGSFPAGVAPALAAEVVAGANGRGVLSVVDVPGPPLREVLAAAPWLVVPNEREAQEATGAPSAAEAAVALHRMGARHAVVTMGGRGFVVATESGITRWVVEPLDEVNGAGAGDAFAAGAAEVLADGGDLEAALRHAAVLGAAAATMPGSGTLPDVMPDVSRLIRQVAPG